MPSIRVADSSTAESSEGVPLLPRRTRLYSGAKTAIGTVAALLGLLAVLWMLLSPVLGLSLVAFATGSMSPTIPQGALALAREVPASELEVGSVAMLQRPGERPISHRILAIAEDPAAVDSRLITMQGDDNPVPDPEPYAVTSGRVILAAVPGGAAAFALLRSPIVMGLLTAGAAALVLRAFWPSPTYPAPENGPE